MIENQWKMYISKLNRINSYGLTETDIEAISKYFDFSVIEFDDEGSQEIIETLIEEYRQNNFPGSSTSR
jgi:hypothetical protein